MYYQATAGSTSFDFFFAGAGLPQGKRFQQIADDPSRDRQGADPVWPWILAHPKICIVTVLLPGRSLRDFAIDPPCKHSASRRGHACTRGWLTLRSNPWKLPQKMATPRQTLSSVLNQSGPAAPPFATAVPSKTTPAPGQRASGPLKNPLRQAYDGRRTADSLRHRTPPPASSQTGAAKNKARLAER